MAYRPDMSRALADLERSPHGSKVRLGAFLCTNCYGAAALSFWGQLSRLSKVLR